MTAAARLAALERRTAAASLAADSASMTADEAFEILAIFVADYRERAGLPPLPPPQQTPPTMADRLAVLAEANRLDAGVGAT